MRIESTDGSQSFFKRHLWKIVAGTAIGLPMVATPISCRTNGPGQMAVKYNAFSGTGDSTYGEGAMFVIPFIEHPIRYDGTSQLVKETVKSQTKDNIPIDVDVVVEWELNAKALSRIHREIVGSGTHVDKSSNEADDLENYISNELNRSFYTKQIRSRLRNTLGDAVKQYTAEDTNDNRDNLTLALRKGFTPDASQRVPSLAEQVNSELVTIRDVFVRNVHLPQNLENAMKARAETLIEKQTAANRIEVEKNNAQAELQKGIGAANKLREEAGGKADAIAKIGEALRKNPEMIQYMIAEAQKAAGEKGGLIITNGSTPPSIILDRK